MRKLLPAALLVPGLAFGWGFDGHRRLASMLQDPLPANLCLKTWFSQRQTTTLQNHACDPDRWRDTANAMYDPAEAPRHYLEIDRVNPPSAYPRDWATVVTTFPQYHDNNGKVPWRVEELYPQLVGAFRTKDTARILDITFVLSHYVTDSFSVLHDTKDFNPGGTLHSRWESTMLSVSSQIAAITTASQGYFGTPGRADPKNNEFDVVLTGNGLAPQLSAAHFANPTDEVAFYNAVKDLTARRWGDAVTLLSSMVWTAWAEAGAPVLLGFPTSGCSMAVPAGEIVFKGYPPSGGFTHPDGGNPPAPDASVMIDDAGSSDAGCLDGCGDDGGMGGTGGGSGTAGGSGGSAGGGEMTPEVPPCGCGAAPGFLGVLLALWCLRRTRR